MAIWYPNDLDEPQKKSKFARYYENLNKKKVVFLK
jgi:hypothetical protein